MAWKRSASKNSPAGSGTGSWNMASADRPSPFAAEALNGLEVFWLAICALAGPDGDLAAAEQNLQNARDGFVHVSLSTLRC